MSPDWHSFVNTEGPRLFRYFFARFDAQTSDDLVQEVLIRVVRKFRSGAFDSSRGNLAAFSFGIAHNVAREAARNHRRSLEDPASDDLLDKEDPIGNVTIDEALSQEQELNRLRSAILKLTNPEQEIISLLVSQDRSLAEVAALLNLPLNTVKSHIHRAKAKLRQDLTDPSGDKKGR
jgi:RNA polymerase sigma-70 factor (ECF subfamily)